MPWWQAWISGDTAYGRARLTTLYQMHDGGGASWRIGAVYSCRSRAYAAQSERVKKIGGLGLEPRTAPPARNSAPPPRSSVRSCLWNQPSHAPRDPGEQETFTVTHPFHPR